MDIQVILVELEHAGKVYEGTRLERRKVVICNVLVQEGGASVPDLSGL